MHHVSEPWGICPLLWPEQGCQDPSQDIGMTPPVLSPCPWLGEEGVFVSCAERALACAEILHSLLCFGRLGVQVLLGY